MYKTSNLYFYIIIIFAVIITGLIFYFFEKNDNSIVEPEIIVNNISPENEHIVIPEKLETSSGVVPHHLLAKDMIDTFWKNIAVTGEPETLILLSPDHFNNGWFGQENNLLSVDYDQVDFNNVSIDNDLISRIDNLVEASNYLALDHGLTAHLPFIKKYLPETKIVPILIPSQINIKTIENFTRQIAKNASNQTMVVASVDFSHYLPKNISDFHDIKSINTLVNFDNDQFESIEVDCWQCLYSARLFSRLRGKESLNYLEHDNSANLTNLDNPDETTSYYSLTFKQGDMEQNKNFTGQTMIFVGDIMLDRGVEALMKKKSIFYPFDQVKRFFKGVDFVVGNLEGPIIKDPPQFGGDSLQFAFAPEVLEALKFSSFNIFSLANNHTLNMGKDGLEETRDLLDKEKINHIGDPIDCHKKYSYIKDDLVFMGINVTFSANCSNEKLSETINVIKNENPDKFIVVSIHWGSEYKTSHNSGQQKKAHTLIDAGVDLIIGHHPHVVQDIEIYKNKLIFYSLGNFIFDQYFSQKTQDGLVIGMEKFEDKLVYRLFPMKTNLSQPRLMSDVDTKEFLKDLSAKSSDELKESIKNGIIEVLR